MTYETLAALSLFAVTTSITPEPNNILAKLFYLGSFWHGATRVPIRLKWFNIMMGAALAASIVLILK